MKIGIFFLEKGGGFNQIRMALIFHKTRNTTDDHGVVFDSQSTAQFGWILLGQLFAMRRKIDRIKNNADFIFLNFVGFFEFFRNNRANGNNPLAPCGNNFTAKISLKKTVRRCDDWNAADA